MSDVKVTAPWQSHNPEALKFKTGSIYIKCLSYVGHTTFAYLDVLRPNRKGEIANSWIAMINWNNHLGSWDRIITNKKSGLIFKVSRITVCKLFVYSHLYISKHIHSYSHIALILRYTFLYILTSEFRSSLVSESTLQWKVPKIMVQLQLMASFIQRI